MTAPVWCDPPAPVKSIWCQLLEPVTEREGEWALVRTYTRHASAVDAVRQLRLSERGQGRINIPAGSWEFVQRQTAPNKPEWGVWAKYGGDA